MSSFSGGSPAVAFSNDELYRLGQAVAQASPPQAPAPTPPPTPTPTPTPTPSGLPSGTAAFSSVQTIDVTLASGAQRLTTSGFTNNTAVVFRITVPSDAPLGAYYRFSGAEFGDQPHHRTAVLSLGSCDFSNSLNAASFQDGTPTITMYAHIGQSDGYYPGLTPGGTYYLNLQNWSYGRSTAGIGESCNMYVDFIKQ